MPPLTVVTSVHTGTPRGIDEVHVAGGASDADPAAVHGPQPDVPAAGGHRDVGPGADDVEVAGAGLDRQVGLDRLDRARPRSRSRRRWAASTRPSDDVAGPAGDLELAGDHVDGDVARAGLHESLPGQPGHR